MTIQSATDDVGWVVSWRFEREVTHPRVSTSQPYTWETSIPSRPPRTTVSFAQATVASGAVINVAGLGRSEEQAEA